MNFLPVKTVAGKVIENVICPVCHSHYRQRFQMYILEKYTNIFSSCGDILHFAPEPMIMERLTRKFSKGVYLTCDKENRYGVNCCVDMTDMQFSDNTFDFIIANHVLEHIVEEKRAINELMRVIKEEGSILMSIPVAWENKRTKEDLNVVSAEDRRREYGEPDHVRLYGRDFKERFEKEGLNVLVYKVENEFNESEVLKYGLDKDDMMMICGK